MPLPSSDLLLPSQGDRDINVLLASGTIDPDTAITELRLQDGRVVQLSTEALLRAGSALPRTIGYAASTTKLEEDSLPSSLLVPLVEERLQISHRTVETGKVRLQKSVQEFETQLDEVLAVRSFDVERVVLNQPVDAPPPIRQDGDTTVYPLVEEQLIVTRQLVLREELRVTRRDTERHDTRPVTLRREIIAVEREPLISDVSEDPAHSSGH